MNERDPELQASRLQEVAFAYYVSEEELVTVGLDVFLAQGLPLSRLTASSSHPHGCRRVGPPAGPQLGRERACPSRHHDDIDGIAGRSLDQAGVGDLLKERILSSVSRPEYLEASPQRSPDDPIPSS